MRVFVVLVILAISASASARDDGRYANSPLKGWFDHLRSERGPCCSDADGVVVEDPDWEVVSAVPRGMEETSHYRVKLDGVWFDVPDSAVITEPNRDGRTMVWPMVVGGETQIRCFMPGSLT